ncbi:hypothetical protein [Haloarcula montana]|uniref:hypothetical protein n=1 Tax=Haloarcula montana TaxID=3111776 RepID=UPI002D77B6DA|nr:hypothetical protein [Haloarcula sp. GH36]
MRDSNIDPTSDGLQYRIIERDGVWLLRREHTEMPLTPDEHLAMAEIRKAMPTRGGRLVVPKATREQLDAEVGDVVSVVEVASAQVQAMTTAVQAAFQPAIEAMGEVVNSFASDVARALGEVSTADGEEQDETDREQRLPKRLREARERREQQREQQRRQAGARYPNTDDSV